MSLVKTNRIESIDILRGLVMILMALDHTRDYFHINAMMGNYPENMESTNGILFATRFITHFCAPVFVFLAGTSAFLYGQKKSKTQLSKFLITRGLWLILVEIIVNNFLWWFDITFAFTNLQVLWAIGFSMIVLGLAVRLPIKVIFILGLIIVFGHNALDGIKATGNDLGSIIWSMLHQSKGFTYAPGRMVWFAYPVLPWIGVMFLGYALGRLYQRNFDSTVRKKWLAYVGLTAIALFFLFRGTNIYGDLVPWESQATTELTIISFFNVAKYPPSLSFLLITLGPALLFLLGIESVKNRVTNFLQIFGRVPFFFYLLHIAIIHLAALIGLIITGKDWHTMILGPANYNAGLLQDYGYSLLTVYVIWVFLILLLYPICKKYMEYKANNRDKTWLSYL